MSVLVTTIGYILNHRYRRPNASPWHAEDGAPFMIESQQAFEALAEINEMAPPRPPVADLQSRSLMLIMWGALCLTAISARSCCRRI